ncbi:hypothetical protein NP493_133g01036 [Ridgeia piscesae]|uniref:EGF-like domain-containing protein n=1 Tax=Ridgeia piscesae TaxID=27915 RepID=A0AAD9UGE7_RIDPI|nr:hypothetical protein NP493_133g01036 [Ridgeia piscesae]
MFMMFCQQEVCINNGDISTARKVALDFADVCMYTSSLAAWPGLDVCDTGGDLRRGTQCYDACRFSTTSTSGQCDCDDGYTGPHCDDLCSGVHGVRVVYMATAWSEVTATVNTTGKDMIATHLLRTGTDLIVASPW